MIDTPRSTTGLRLAADAAIDLHLHTTASDGHWKLDQLLDHLVRAGFALAAVTDHDRTDTLAAVQQRAQAKGLPILAGVEMTTTWRGELVDLLCYGVDPQDNALSALAADLLRRQQENTRQVLEALARQGCAFPPGALAALQAKPSARQPQAIADLLRKLGFGLEEPSAGKMALEAGVAYATNDPSAVVEAAHRSGAVCLLAHPGRGDGFVDFDAALLDAFRQEAPVDGLEAYHPRHTPEKVELFHAYAERHHLLVSAGSDSHTKEKPPIPYRAELCSGLLERLGVTCW